LLSTNKNPAFVLQRHRKPFSSILPDSNIPIKKCFYLVLLALRDHLVQKTRIANVPCNDLLSFI